MHTHEDRANTIKDLNFEAQCAEILDSCRIHLSNLKPSEWFEQNMIMPPGSAFPGRWSYERSPFLREIVDCMSRDSPVHTVAIMKGAQIGVSAGVIMPTIGYTIAENPGNTLMLTGHSDLSEEAMLKVDAMIDQCNIRNLIRPTVLRAKKSRTGDTNKAKEFPGGSLIGGSVTNHNLLRQRDIMVAIVDDFDAAKKSSKDAGDTTKLVEQRTAAYATKRKILYVSSPQLVQQSNILMVFNRGDQRYFHVKCPHCSERISLHWEVEMQGNPKEKGGITYKVDAAGRVVSGSVGYICQICGEFFDDRDKQELLQGGVWIPTAEPFVEGFRSYQISALYAPVGMFSWEHYVSQYLEAVPVNGEVDIRQEQTFTNVVLGLPYEDQQIEARASDLQRNQRNYKPGLIPEQMSLNDGNGRIVMLTLGADLNGVENDARLDFEVVAWSESGASYSVTHGSIGTFIPREGKNKVDREHWTYRHATARSVWPALDEILDTKWPRDTGRPMKIMSAGIDAGYMTQHVYDYVDRSNFTIYLVKGDITAKFNPYQKDQAYFKTSRERGNMYILEVNAIKDELAVHMSLKHDPKHDDRQPGWFMNFPESSGGLYQFANFFSHFEAEHRVVSTNARGEPVGTRWEKKDTVVQNHLWDCRVYNIAIRQILADMVCKQMKIRHWVWADYVDVIAKASGSSK